MDVSVVIPTYNRRELLAGALEPLLAQRSDGVRYEIIVVDNNSADGTGELVRRLAARDHAKLRCVVERSQGSSHARNAGIRQAMGPVVAFTDDDVRVADNWVAAIARAFGAHPEAGCVGGRVLPRWPRTPPAWLTREHWAPLALQDHGIQPFYTDAGRRVGLVGANLAVRRDTFERVGGFSPGVQKVCDSVGSTEDHEFLARVWRAGGRTLYVPDLIVTADVQPDRLTRTYHRRWHAGHGRFYARMRSPDIETSATGRLLDVPAHLYRQALRDAAAWLTHLGRRDPARAFVHETRLWFFAGFVRQRLADRRSRRHFSPADAAAARRP